mgnify:CR=1 FL=1
MPQIMRPANNHSRKLLLTVPHLRNSSQIPNPYYAVMTRIHQASGSFVLPLNEKHGVLQRREKQGRNARPRSPRDVGGGPGSWSLGAPQDTH